MMKVILHNLKPCVLSVIMKNWLICKILMYFSDIDISLVSLER